MAKRTYSEETKAAVMAALLAGQSVSQVAAEYKIPEGTIWAWTHRELNGKSNGYDASLASAASQKKQRIAELILEYLEALFVALKNQAELFGDNKNWLSKQAASEVAVLHGVLADKGIRILEALASAAEEQDV